MRTRQPGQSALLLLDVIAVLKAQTIAYAVIGAMAASVHGELRATADADALISVSASRFAGLRAVFKKAGFETDLRRGAADDPIPAMLVLGDRYGNRVDLLGGLRGLDPQAFARTVPVRLSMALRRRSTWICCDVSPAGSGEPRPTYSSSYSRVDRAVFTSVSQASGVIIGFEKTDQRKT